jgi:hypothetical protein
MPRPGKLIVDELALLELHERLTVVDDADARLA